MEGGIYPGAVEPTRQQVIGLLAKFHLFDAEVRVAALQTLARMSREPVLAILTACLGDADAEIRADAAEALLRLDAQRTVPLVMPLLHDPLPEMRWHLCGLLSAWGDARAVLPLTTIIREDGLPWRRVIEHWRQLGGLAAEDISAPGVVGLDAAAIRYLYTHHLGVPSTTPLRLGSPLAEALQVSRAYIQQIVAGTRLKGAQPEDLPEAVRRFLDHLLVGRPLETCT